MNFDVKKHIFFKNLTNLPFIKKIILYGSRARNDSKERSDIDLAIECPNITDAEWNKILTIIENADTLLKIDCVRFDTLEPENPLRTSIMRDGIILYQKEGV